MKHFNRVLKYAAPQYKTVIISIACALGAAMLFSMSIAAMLPLMRVMIGEEGLHGWVNRGIVKHRSGIVFESVTIEENPAALGDTETPPQPLRIFHIREKTPAENSGLAKDDIVLLVTQKPRLQGGSPQGSTLQGGSPQGGTLQGGTPQGGTLQGGTLQGGSPQGSTLQGGSPQGSTLQGGSPQGGTPQGSTLQEGTSQGSALDGGTSQGGPLEVSPSRNQLLQHLAGADSDQPVQLTIKHTDDSVESISIDLDKPPIYAPAARWLLGFVPYQQGASFKRNCIVLIIVLMWVATIVRCTLRFVQEYLVRRISYRSIMSLRRDAYAKAVRIPLSYFSQEGVSDTMSRFVQDSNRIHRGITILFGKMIREPFTIIGLTAGAFWINSDMTLIVLMGAPVAALVISKLGKKIKRATKKTLESWSRMLGHLQGTLLGIRVVKGYHQETSEETRFTEINQKLLKQQFRVAKIEASSGPIIESLGITAACAGMICAAYYLFGKPDGDMKTSDFFTLVMLLASMAESGRKLGDVYPDLQVANASAERVYRLIDTPIETDPPQAVKLERLSRSIEFRNINFRYPDSLADTLSDINLTVEAGQTIAVVGPNGSGKTTLLSLVPRFFIPEKGAILFDGTDIAQGTLSSLREQIGIVTQQTVVFNDTIEANIAYSRPQAGKEKVIEAAKQAYAHEFIEQTPNGYQTIVGEQGAKLSGGQLQRIAIARAILLDPAILIFDEAMSQIDSDSEAKIQKALTKFTQNRTSFIIAHRLSTIIDADRIIVLDNGRLIAQGKHQELIKSCKLYRRLYEMQFAT